ncbi:MAG: FHA domain-containing protein [Alphaproteobacteria bacterium]|nr:FHA domain-containing protein [Alphaproteobacteria bacterium]MCB9695283.1 FHA domain-containing protein [Alphaproteobacteria bacterium]
MIKQPGQQDRVVRLPEGATRMGRAEDNEVVLADAGVSRRHAQVFVSRNEVTVEDLGSGNGTYYNGYRVQSQPIQDGDEIVIDPFVLQFRVRGSTAQSGNNVPARGGPGTPATSARLEVVVGKGMAGSSYPISSRGLSIGRSEDRDVVIPDPAASRHHAQITVQGADYVLRDMGASNGIFVNAVRVRECTLADGDMVRIGNTEMRFVRYDEGAGEHPTAAADMRMVQQQWNNEPVPSQRPMMMSEPPARRKSSRARPLIAMVLGTVIVFVALLVVLVIVVVGVIAYVKFRPVGISDIPPEPPGWVLREPPGLPPQRVSELFDAGRDKMRNNDRRGALLDFYRALKADPGYPYVDKFAFAAGEYLVMEELAKEFAARSVERRDRAARRDDLLGDLKSRNVQKARRAEQILIREYKADPVVMERLDLPKPEAMIAIEKMQSEATEKLAVQKYDEASLLFQKVLAESDDPKTRTAALTNLRLSQKEVARSSQQMWSEAVKDSRTDRAVAENEFRALSQAHPANPSAPVHLERMK